MKDSYRQESKLTCAGFSHFLRKSSLALARNSLTVGETKKHTQISNLRAWIAPLIEYSDRDSAFEIY